jgi:hypothetical protein
MQTAIAKTLQPETFSPTGGSSNWKTRRPPPMVLTSAKQVIQFQKQLIGMAKQNFKLRNTRNSTRVIAYDAVDFSTVKNRIENSNLSYFTFFPMCRQSQQYFSECFYYYFLPTTCFGPYGPSSGGIYTCQILGATFATTDPLFLSSFVYKLGFVLGFFTTVCMYAVDSILCNFVTSFQY